MSLYFLLSNSPMLSWRWMFQRRYSKSYQATLFGSLNGTQTSVSGDFLMISGEICLLMQETGHFWSRSCPHRTADLPILSRGTPGTGFTTREAAAAKPAHTWLESSLLATTGESLRTATDPEQPKKQNLVCDFLPVPVPSGSRRTLHVTEDYFYSFNMLLFHVFVYLHRLFSPWILLSPLNLL